MRRRQGATELLHQIIGKCNGKRFFLSCDEGLDGRELNFTNLQLMIQIRTTSTVSGDWLSNGNLAPLYATTFGTKVSTS
jgi:hypothetical protein